MYDAFSVDYDRFVNWEGRLAFELPFIERALQEIQARRVLDAATGTGMHVIALAQRGYQAYGADLSLGMIEKARQNAAQVGVSVEFLPASFGNLALAFASKMPFDALLCLGNSLPHLLTPADLNTALQDFSACLRPGGLLLIQNRNFDSVLATGQRWMEPQSHRENDQEWIFVRFYDFLTSGLINFNILTLQRGTDTPWQQNLHTTQLYPHTQVELSNGLKLADFEQVEYFGGLDGSPFAIDHSGNLVVAARKSK